ncbi:ABC transporter ATP-binding protein [Stenoxybacter acetivorans]|uniref:ABC transporter ATP-binding protein n=1 Tax=Stenoxybacter acetivorans TaxID=422441 RepID=UPI000563946C|nr:dipeptide ABC transporter ATP-binding protein [Stenoxybacter acetivorans]
MNALLNISGLNAFFGKKQVLFDIDLGLQAGEKHALIGESGSGKTVLAQGIMQLNEQARFSGSLKFGGKELLGALPSQLRKIRGCEIGMVFQEPMSALNPVMKIGQQIAEVFTLHLGLPPKEAHSRAIALLADMEIKDAEQKAQAYPFQLSGGQRQRAMIALALAAEPKLLIADEPTTALDAAVQAQILTLLARLQAERGMAVLYISHDLNLVRRFADKVSVMQHGRIVETGNTQDIFCRPQHEYTRLLLNARAARFNVPLPENTAEVLDADNITVSVQQKSGWLRRREIPLLQPVSFRLRYGETLGIIGESGSGKTTLAKALMHLIPFSGSLKAQGTVSLLGKPWQTAMRRNMQMVFQDPFGALNPRLTVFEIVTEALQVHEPHLSLPQRKQQVIDVLHTVGLPEDILPRYPHAFSGGQRQRIALARALITRPQVLILDEPTSALDVQWQQQLLALLADLQHRLGLSYVLISHDLAVIRALSHRVLVLKDGEVIESGDCEAVFASPNTAYTQKLLQYSLA